MIGTDSSVSLMSLLGVPADDRTPGWARSTGRTLGRRSGGTLELRVSSLRLFKPGLGIREHLPPAAELVLRIHDLLLPLGHGSCLSAEHILQVESAALELRVGSLSRLETVPGLSHDHYLEGLLVWKVIQRRSGQVLRVERP